MKEKELQQLVDELWKRMEPLARAELERLFTNYMSTRTLLEPELVKKLFDAMQKDLQRFMQEHLREVGTMAKEEVLSNCRGWYYVPCRGKAYWDALWEKTSDARVLVLRNREDGKYYATARTSRQPATEDRGPFDTLSEATVCADMMLELNAVPEGW